MVVEDSKEKENVDLSKNTVHVLNNKITDLQK